MNLQARLWALFVMRVLLGGMWLWAGFAKGYDPKAFQQEIYLYQIVSFEVATFMALYLPWVEVLTGLALVGKVCYEGALALSLAMMTAFTVALTSAWIRGLRISCGCFGASETPADYAWVLSRDLFLLGWIGFLIFVEVRCHLRACSIASLPQANTVA